MDFAFTADERAFAEEVRRFLREHPLEQFPLEGMDAGYGSGAHSRAFMRALGAQGWLSMSWPKAYGGQERPMFFKLVLLEELALAGAPFGPLGRLLADRRRHHRLRQRAPAARGVAADRPRRGHVLAGVQRARRRLRSARRSRPRRGATATTT